MRFRSRSIRSFSGFLVAAVACIAAVVSPAFAHGVEVASIEEAHRLLHAGELSNADAQSLHDFFAKRFKQKGRVGIAAGHRIERTDDGGGFAAWCIEAPADAAPAIVAEKGRRWPMTRLGKTQLWAWVEKFPNFSSVHYRFEVNGVRLGGAHEDRFGFESYTWLPDSLEQPGVPQGKLTDMGMHVSKTHFKGAERRWWVYAPANFESLQQPLKLLVVNDGGGYARGKGNVCTVLDNLIHKKKVPPMIAVFVDPGEYPADKPRGQRRSNRGNEYDTCTPRFATFLDEEILPQVRKTYRISDDPRDHAIMGASSGGSCAMTAAWHRNDLFRRVVSFVGSFCDFRSLGDYPIYGAAQSPTGEFGPWKTAHDYPSLIRRTPPKPIKIFLQDGENDLDNSRGNWFQNNRRMESALAYAGYDYRFVAGKGMHSRSHGMSILPEILVWLWDDSNAKR